MSGKSVVIGLFTVLVILGGIIYFTHRSGGFSFFKKLSSSKQTQNLSDAVNADHFVSSSPKHGEMFARAPFAIVVNSDISLSTNSNLAVEKDGENFSDGETVIDNNGLTLRQKMIGSASDGTYTVKYTMCDQTNACQDGQFQFVISEKEKESYVDIRGQANVEISMSDLQFKPEKIIVDQGTLITWKNDEAAIHFVTSDPEKENTVFQQQNSREIKQGEMYSVLFEVPGEYPYNCKAHVSSGMTGRVIVE